MHIIKPTPDKDLDEINIRSSRTLNVEPPLAPFRPEHI
jgi:hypothetical protein